MVPKTNVFFLLGVVLLQCAIAARPIARNLCEVNICFAFDESSATNQFEFDIAKLIANQIANELGQGSIFSAVGYPGNEASQILQYPTSSLESFSSAVVTNTQSYPDFTGPATNIGIHRCGKFLSRINNQSPKVIVLLTTGHDAHLINVVTRAAAVKAIGIFVTAIDITQNGPSNLQNLKLLATHPSLAVHYSEIDSFIFYGSFQQVICEHCCKVADICYAIDESSSISYHQFQDMRLVLTEVISTYELLAPGSQYSATGFNEFAQPISGLTSAIDINIAVSQNAQAFGDTSSGSGLQQSVEYLHSSSNFKIIVLLTGGQDNHHPFGNDPDVLSSLDGHAVITGGIGPYVDSMALAQIAYPNGFIQVPDFASLSNATAGQIAKSMCEARLKPVTTSTPGTPVPMPPSQCFSLVCSTYGKVQECFIQSGNQFFDKEVCKYISTLGIRR